MHDFSTSILAFGWVSTCIYIVAIYDSSISLGTSTGVILGFDVSQTTIENSGSTLNAREGDAKLFLECRLQSDIAKFWERLQSQAWLNYTHKRKQFAEKVTLNGSLASISFLCARLAIPESCKSKMSEHD